MAHGTTYNVFTKIRGKDENDNDGDKVTVKVWM